MNNYEWSYEKLSNGVWVCDICTERIFNQDENPQFINYGVDHSALGLDTVLLLLDMLAEGRPARRQSKKTDSHDNAKDVEKLTLSQRKVVKVLKATWKSLGLYHDEEDLKGK